MIKIGKCYFNGSQIAAIQPRNDGQRADVILTHGLVIPTDVLEEDLPALLRQAGLLPSAGADVEILTFSPKEHQELLLAYKDGYLFVAKDKTGQVYAYNRPPIKRTYEWGTAEGTVAQRLYGEFECLSFEDDEPLSLDALFSGDDAEEVDE